MSLTDDPRRILREIRMALGADQTRVLRMVLGEVLIGVAFGVGVGIAGALAAARLVAVCFTVSVPMIR